MEIHMGLHKGNAAVLTFRPRMLSVLPSQKGALSSAFSLILGGNIIIKISASCRCVLFFSLHQSFWIILNNSQRLFILNGEVLTHYDDKALHPFEEKKGRKHYPQNCNIISSVLCRMFTEQHWKSLKCQIVISSCVRPPTNKWFIFLSTDTSQN